MRFYSYGICESLLNLMKQFFHPLPNELDHCAGVEIHGQSFIKSWILDNHKILAFHSLNHYVVVELCVKTWSKTSMKIPCWRQLSLKNKKRYSKHELVYLTPSMYAKGVLRGDLLLLFFIFFFLYSRASIYRKSQ